MKILRINTKNILAHLIISLIIFTLFFQSTIGPYNKANAQSYTPCKCASHRTARYKHTVVVKHGIALTLFVSPTSLTTGQSYTVGTTLKDFSANVALPGKTISFTADSPVTISQQTTDSLGKTKTTLEAPSSGGIYDIQAHYAGDSLYSAKDLQ